MEFPEPCATSDRVPRTLLERGEVSAEAMGEL
ncbi:hypothetical protein QFZ64_002963 [Streptomyces sp. B3I8]|nr:hypothetical protein [Streptomyces sp. B3I8]